MIKSLTRTATCAVIIGILSAIAASLFLYSCSFAIQTRKMHPELIYFLPLIGVVVTYFYHQYGRDIQRGNALILDEIHHPQKKIPIKMVPMIFVSTTFSHLFGASVGREGVAVQMGAALADYLHQKFDFFFSNRKIVLMTGMSAGFSAIFGSPLAGAAFGIEVLYHPTASRDAIFSCLLGSISAFYFTKFLGVHHVHYPLFSQWFSWGLFISSIVLGLICGLCARLYLGLLHIIKKISTKTFKQSLISIFLSGTILVCYFHFSQTDRYLSLGEDIIKLSFLQKVFPWDFFFKILSTSISVGGGFKGGEVMSLFFIGATLGNSLSVILPAGLSALSSLGFVSVFAGAVNAPLTALFLACELFGVKIFFMGIITTVISYIVSGKDGIYSSRRTHYLIKN